MELRIAIPEAQVDEDVLNAGLEVTTRLDEKLIADGKVPLFRDANPGDSVVWRPEPPGAEHFDHAARVLSRGFGDCDDLAPWHASSLRASGEDPGATAVVYQSGPNRWHAVVRRSDGSIDDPSREAGMMRGRPMPPIPDIAPPRVSGDDGDDGDDFQGDDGDDGSSYDASADQGDDQGDGGGSSPDAPPDAPAPPSGGGKGKGRPAPPSGGGRARGVPPHLSIAPPVVPHMFSRGRRPAVAVRRSVHGYQARADLPYLDSEYSLSSVRQARGATDAIIGAVSAVCGYARSAGCARGRDVKHLTALAGLLQGESPREIARLCGADAVKAAMPLVRSVVEMASVVGDAPNSPLLPPAQVTAAAKQAINSPLVPPAGRKLAAILLKHASGVRPPRTSLKGAIMRYFDTTQGPVRPNSPDDHARLLIADQAAKRLTQPGAPMAGMPIDAPAGTSTTVGDLFGDIGNALGQAGQAVASVVKQVGPVVAQVAQYIPPPYGTAIGLAAQGATALANAASPNAKTTTSAPASAAPATAAAMANVTTPGAAAAAHPATVPGGAPVPRYIHFVPGTGGHVLVSFAG